MTTITTWKYLPPKPQSFYKQLFVNGRIQALREEIQRIRNPNRASA